MPPTVQNIIDRAVDRSGLNESSHINIPSTISMISYEQRKVYLVASQLDPEYFGKTGLTAARAAFTDTWDLDTTPGDVAGVTSAKVDTIVGTVSGVTVGATVNLVNSRYAGFDAAPRAYIRGRKIEGHSTELGADSSNMVTKLSLNYSELPPIVSAVGTTLRLPDEWQALLILPVARMLALRDKREEEVQIIDGEYTAAMDVFQRAVIAYGHGARRPLSLISPLAPQSPRKG